MEAEARSCRISVCRSCGARIVWTWTMGRRGELKARMPIDAEPVADGNVEIIDWTRTPEQDEWTPVVRTLLKGEAESPTLLDPPPRYKSHFATCPDADTHRRR